MTGFYTVIEPNPATHKSIFKPTALVVPPTLTFMQNLVGGPIEVIPKFTSWQGQPCIAICNEEGKMRNLPLNITATESWKFITETYDYLVGTVVVFQGSPEFLKSIL